MHLAKEFEQILNKDRRRHKVVQFAKRAQQWRK